MMLAIDTTKIRVATVTIGPYTKTSTDVLLVLQALLDEHHIRLADITDITVQDGPGSYTGVRVGMAIANMLGTLLAIPVNGKKAIATPTYS